MINISEHANRILSVVKAKYGLRDKSQAIERVATEYEEEILEPGLKPAFVKSVLKAEKGKFKRVRNIDDLFK